MKEIIYQIMFVDAEPQTKATNTNKKRKQENVFCSGL